MAQNDAVLAGSIPQLCDHRVGALFFAPFATDMARRLFGMTAVEKTWIPFPRRHRRRARVAFRAGHHGGSPGMTPILQKCQLRKKDRPAPTSSPSCGPASRRG
jgi:hypothetical protein